MNRAALEQLDREALIERAEASGVTRARVLTRPELVDELLLRSTTDYATKQRARGFFGLARDLIARVIEQGLHLPDAAERVRAMGATARSIRPSAPAAMPTVTLAEIYAAQGHRGRAIETLERVLGHEPDHPAALGLLSRMRDESYPVPPPRMPPEEETTATRASPDLPESDDFPPADVADSPVEPSQMLDDAPLPPRYDVDECVAIPVDPSTLYVYWEVRERTLETLRAARPHGTIVLRVVVIVPSWDGPESSVRDSEVHATLGDFFARNLPPGCVVRAAIGYRADGEFVAAAHSPALETPPDAPSPLVAERLLRWTPSGALVVSPSDSDAPSIARALAGARKAAAREQRARASAVFAPARSGGNEGWPADQWGATSSALSDRG